MPDAPKRLGGGYTRADYSYSYDASRYDNGPVDAKLAEAGSLLAELGIGIFHEGEVFEPAYDSYDRAPECDNIDMSGLKAYFDVLKKEDPNYYVGTGSVFASQGTGSLYGDETGGGSGIHILLM